MANINNTIPNHVKKRLFKQYKNILRNNKDLFKTKHNLQIDWIYRLYKVYNVPIEEVYNIHQYGTKYLNELVKKDIKNIDNTLMALNLIEIVGITKLDIIDELNVRVELSFKYFDLLQRMKKKLFTWSIVSVIILTIIFLLLK